MNLKKFRFMLLIILIIFLPTSFYLIQNELLSLSVRNIVFGIIFISYLVTKLFLKEENIIEN